MRTAIQITRCEKSGQIKTIEVVGEYENDITLEEIKNKINPPVKQVLTPSPLYSKEVKTKDYET